MIQELLAFGNRFQHDLRREDRYYQALVDDPLHETPANELRMYIVVRSDLLPPINQGIQALHAVTELIVNYAQADNLPKWTEERFAQWMLMDKTVVLLGVHSQEHMDSVIARAVRKNRIFDIFEEPDLGNVMTAAAFEPMTPAEGKDIFFGVLRAE